MAFSVFCLENETRGPPRDAEAGQRREFIALLGGWAAVAMIALVRTSGVRIDTGPLA